MYTQKSSHDELADLARRLKEPDAQRLPRDDYRTMRNWLERADRARWQGEPEKQLDLNKQRAAKDGAEKTLPHNFRASLTGPQRELLANPVIGLFTFAGSIANQALRWVKLTDTRDYLGELEDALEEDKKRKHDDCVASDRTKEQREKDEQAIERIDKVLEETKNMRKKRKKERETEREKRDRGLDYLR